MNSEWKNLRLGSFCDVIAGGTPPRSNSAYYGGSIPWVKISDMLQGEIFDTDEKITAEALANCNTKLLPEGTILLSIFATIGRTAVLRVPATTNQAIVGIIPRKDDIDKLYFRHFLDAASVSLASKGRGVAQNNINSSILRDIEIPIPHKNGKPDLSEQKRIAAILDKADAIRRKLQQSLRLSDDFLRSVFLDMFGDPVTNPKGWPVEPLSEGVESFDGGKNVNPCDTDRRDGMRVLKVSAVTSGEYLDSESKSFGEDFIVPTDYIVKPGDLLISRANTAELVGAVAYVWNTSGQAMLPDKLWRFVWSKPAKIHPLFMLHMARTGHFRKQLILRATGSSGSMKNIGKVKMLEIPIPLPPISLQNKFAAVVNQTQAKIQKSTAFLQDAETLFSTLQQRAFRGEL